MAKAITIKNQETGELEEHWSGDFIFENEWQFFRTKKDCTLELEEIEEIGTEEIGTEYQVEVK